MQRLGLAGHKNASYALLAQLGLLVLHFVLESACQIFALHADAYRLAFADPEFLFRRETRGIRFQLEMLKPDLGQAEDLVRVVSVFQLEDEGGSHLGQASLQRTRQSLQLQ